MRKTALKLGSIDDRFGGIDIFVIDHHPYRDQQIAAVGDARPAVEGDRIDPLGVEPPDDDIGEVAIVATQFDEAHGTSLYGRTATPWRPLTGRPIVHIIRSWQVRSTCR